MSEYSRGQEREEKRRIASGVKTSVFGLILCWVPVLGALLSSIGFVRVCGTITQRYRKRFRTGLLVTLIILIISLSVLTFEVYQYTHYPWIVDDMSNWFMERILGQYTDSYDYGGQYVPSMGMDDVLYSGAYNENGYYNDRGEFIPYAEADMQAVPDNETGG